MFKKMFMGKDIYINKNISETIKGILIILIVFGHNHVLCPNNVTGGMMDYLYMFHVICFFILPFFYENNNQITSKHLGSVFIRCWIPYFWICLICLLCTCLYRKSFVLNFSIVLAFVQGTQTPIRDAFGFVFPWFLPTYCSFVILLLFARKFKVLMFFFTLISIFTWFLSWHSFYIFKNVIPLGLGLAISYFGAGSLCYYGNRNLKYMKIWSLIIFTFLSWKYWNQENEVLLYKLFPVFFFSCLLGIAPLIHCRPLKILGKYSLGIYLFHMFFTDVSFLLLPHTTFWGVIGFFLSLSLSLFVSYFILKYEMLHKIFFPRSIDDIKSVFSKK